MRFHSLHKIIAGKSISLYADGLYENKLHIKGDYYMRVDMDSMTMSDILIYAQYKIDRARHKLDTIEKELSEYTTRDCIIAKLKKSQKMHKILAKDWPGSDLGREYDIDFECQYVALAQERLQQINQHFPDTISTYRMIDSVRNLIQKYNLTHRDTAYNLKLDQACKEWLHDLDKKSHIVDLCSIYNILFDIANVSEHFKPYNMSYGTIQIDVGGICFWVCNHDEYNNLSPKKRALLAQQSYLIDSAYKSVESMWYTVYLYIPTYIERYAQDISPDEQQLSQKIIHKAIQAFIQELDLESMAFYSGMLVCQEGKKV